MKHPIHLTAAAALLASGSIAVASPAPVVDAGAFRDKPSYARKKGIVVDPATVRMIVPGMNKDAVYRIVGTPHFGETITRRFDYVLNLTGRGDEAALRCRMQVVFGRPAHRPVTSEHTAVTQVLWQTQPCADRVAAG